MRRQPRCNRPWTVALAKNQGRLGVKTRFERQTRHADAPTTGDCLPISLVDPIYQSIELAVFSARARRADNPLGLG